MRPGIRLALENFEEDNSALIAFEREQEIERAADAARDEGYSEGFEAGRNEAVAEAQEALATAQAIRASVDGEMAALPARVDAAIVSGLSEIIKGLLPALAARGLADEIARILGEVRAPFAEAKLTVLVSEDQSAPLAVALEALGQADDIEIKPTPGLGTAAAQITWKDGGVEIDLEKAVDEILEAFDAR